MFTPLKSLVAFTTNYEGIVNALYTKCGINRAFNPNIQHNIKPHDFNAIWDTGATNSVISKNVVDTLGLKSTGKEKVGHVNGVYETEIYGVSIFLPNNVCFLFLKLQADNCQKILMF